MAPKHVPVAFVRLGGAPNHAPVHLADSSVAQVRGLEHPESLKVRQARSKKTSCVDLELFVRELATFSLSLKMVAPASGAKKSEHSSHQTLKKAFGTPSKALQSTPCLSFGGKGVLQTSSLCIRANPPMHRDDVLSTPEARKHDRHVI